MQIGIRFVDLGKIMSLVMAEAFGYALPLYQIFVRSLRQSGYTGDVSILAPPNRTLPECVTFLESQRVALHITTDYDSKRHNSQRFWIYATLCSAPKYRYCLATDFRDVFFQADPFAPFMQSSSAAPDKAIDLVLPLEERELHTDKINIGCIRNCFPRAWLVPERQRVYANVSVICSGAIFGTPTGFGLLAQLLVPLAAMCRLDKMSDQAALNFLIYYSPALEVYAVRAPTWADGSQTLPDGRVGALLYARAHTSFMSPGYLSAPRSAAARMGCSNTRSIDWCMHRWSMCREDYVAIHCRATCNNCSSAGSSRHTAVVGAESRHALSQNGSGHPLTIALQPRGTGAVNTVGSYKMHVAEFMRRHVHQGLVRNADGTPSPLVHQYDRLVRGEHGFASVTPEAEAIGLRFRAIDRALGRGPMTPIMGRGR